MDYTFFTDLQEELTLPEKGILSRVLHKDEKVNVTLFGLAAGEKFSAHSLSTYVARDGRAEDVKASGSPHDCFSNSLCTSSQSFSVSGLLIS